MCVMRWTFRAVVEAMRGVSTTARAKSSAADRSSLTVAVMSPRSLNIRSAIGTPIVVDGRIWGAMLAGWTGTEMFHCSRFAG
jgi:hypothetical protein